MGSGGRNFVIFLKISMTKPNFGPIETLIISLRFLFLNQPRRSLEGLSRCRVILLTRFNVPWLQISEIFGTSQPPVTRLAGVPLWIVDRGMGFHDFWTLRPWISRLTDRPRRSDTQKSPKFQMCKLCAIFFGCVDWSPDFYI